MKRNEHHSEILDIQQDRTFAVMLTEGVNAVCIWEENKPKGQTGTEKGNICFGAFVGYYSQSNRK